MLTQLISGKAGRCIFDNLQAWMLYGSSTDNKGDAPKPYTGVLDYFFGVGKGDVLNHRFSVADAIRACNLRREEATPSNS